MMLVRCFIEASFSTNLPTFSLSYFSSYTVFVCSAVMYMAQYDFTKHTFFHNAYNLTLFYIRRINFIIIIAVGYAHVRRFTCSVTILIILPWLL